MDDEDIVVTVKVAENGGSVPMMETSDDFISKKEGGKGEVKEMEEDNKCDVTCETETVAEEPTATREKESIEEVVDEKKLSKEETKDVNESEDIKEEEKQELRDAATKVVSESKENNEAPEKEESVTEFVGEEFDTEEAEPMEETVTETTVVECVTTETVQVITQVMEVEKEDVIVEMAEEGSEPKEMETVAVREKELTLKEGELEVTDEVKEKDESKPEPEAKEMEENKEVEAEEKEENKDEVEAEKQESKEDMKVQGKDQSKETTEAKEEESKEVDAENEECNKDMEVEEEERKEDMKPQEEISKEKLDAKEEGRKEVEAENEERNTDMEVEKEEESKDDMETQENEESEDKVHDEVKKIEANSKRKKSRRKKRSRSRSEGKTKARASNDKTKDVKLKKELEPKTPVAYVNDRPVRERKSVERLVAVVDNDSSRELHIRKGPGTALKDIPNVSYKISRAKTDDIFKLLHMVLYGRRAKAIEVKHNVSQFSGFVWNGDEEKQRLKIKEKLDKFPKDQLLEFCDLLDIPIPKPSSIRKEDVLLKLIDFLEAPSAMTGVLLGEKEQGSNGSKRKRPAKKIASSGATPSKDSAKRQRNAVEDSKEEAKSPVGTDDESDKDDEIVEEENEKDQTEEEKHSSGEEKENESDGGSVEKSNKRKRNSSSGMKQSIGKKEAQEIPTTRKRSTPQAKVTQKKSHPNSSKADNDESPKMLSRKSKDLRIAKEAPSTPKEKSGKTISKGKETPSDSELRDTICEILKEVDFNIATFTDILRRLGKKFKKDLTSRKAPIKHMIQEELTKLTDEEDDDGNSDSEKDEVKVAKHKVKA